MAQEDVMTTIKTHIKAGDAKQVANYFNELVEISINGEKGSYSKTQGEFILKEAFVKKEGFIFKNSDFLNGLNYKEATKKIMREND